MQTKNYIFLTVYAYSKFMWQLQIRIMHFFQFMSPNLRAWSAVYPIKVEYLMKPDFSARIEGLITLHARRSCLATASVVYLLFLIFNSDAACIIVCKSIKNIVCKNTFLWCQLLDSICLVTYFLFFMTHKHSDQCLQQFTTHA